MIGVEAVFDDGGKYTGVVAFDINGGGPFEYRTSSEEELRNGVGLNPAVAVGRGDRHA